MLNVVMLVCMLLVFFFFVFLFSYMFLVVFFVIIMLVMFGLIEYEKVYYLFKMDKFDFLICISVFLVVFFMGMEIGFMISVSKYLFFCFSKGFFEFKGFRYLFQYLFKMM